jgi:hypothetical protein
MEEIELQFMDQYLQLIEEWGTRRLGDATDLFDPMNYLRRGVAQRDLRICSALQWRQNNLSSTDDAFVEPFIEAGMFGGDPLAKGLLVASVEMNDSRRGKDLAASTLRYKSDDPLSAETPGIESHWSKRKEMVSLSMLKQIERSGEFEFEGKPTKLTSLLNPEVVNFVASVVPRDRIEVRLDPFYPSSHSDPPTGAHTPVLPEKCKELLFGVPFRNLLTTVRMPVQKPLPQDGHGLIEYAALGLRSLDVHWLATKGRAELYLEELSDTGRFGIDPNGEVVELEPGVLLGRMIHCDTIADLDSPCDDVELIHLDLGFYVYRDDQKEERLARPPQSRVETKEHIHLFKVAPLRATMLPGIAWLFLEKSRRLLENYLKSAMTAIAVPGPHEE